MGSRRVFLLLFLLPVFGFESWPRQIRQEIRVQTTLVNVPVMVSGPGGELVLNLKAEDFALYDDGVRQPLAFFAAAEEPIRMALLMDTSKSTATVIDQIRKAAADFITQLRPKDQAMAVSFDSDVRTLCRWSSDQHELKQAIRRAEVGGYVGTKMRDAVHRVAGRYLRSGQGRKAIILLTDGQDFGSEVSPEEMIRTVVDSGIVVYAAFYTVNRRDLAKKLFGISLPKGIAAGAAWEESERSAEAFLRRVAEESAGAFFRSEVTDLRKTFARVADELRHQYLLAFYPDPSRVDGTQHALSVTLSRSGLAVRARRSYQASASSMRTGPAPAMPRDHGLRRRMSGLRNRAGPETAGDARS